MRKLLTKGNKALILSFSHTRNTLQFTGSLLLRVGHGRGIVDCLPGVSELLQEHLGQNNVIAVAEIDGEDDDSTVSLGFKVHGLVVAVVDGDDGHVTLVCYSIEELEERSGDDVPLEQRYVVSDSVFLVSQVIQVELKGIVIARFRVDHQGAVDRFDTGVRAVRTQLRNTPPLNGDGHQVPLLRVGGYVEYHTVEVSEGDIDCFPLGAKGRRDCSEQNDRYRFCTKEPLPGNPLFDDLFKDAVVCL